MTTPREEANSKLEAMKRAYSDYPSQDNEGWVPDRGSFKAGFCVAWGTKEDELTAMRKRAENLEGAYGVLSKERAELHVEIAAARARIAELETQLANKAPQGAKLLLKIATLEAVVERYEGALRFYADPNSWRGMVHESPGSLYSEGYEARQAIADGKKMKGENK